MGENNATFLYVVHACINLGICIIPDWRFGKAHRGLKNRTAGDLARIKDILTN
jgi:hypothetical protein